MDRNTFTAEQEKWLTALESGEYRQTQFALHSAGAHCCLGVADIVCGLGEVSIQTLETSYHKIKLRDESGRLLTDTGGSKYLTELNDFCSWPFPRIAAFIRAKPWQVFTNFDVPEDRK